MTKILDADGQQVNGNGTNGMPWQVRAIGFFGVPSAIAIYLVWNMTGMQAKDISDAKAQLAEHATASAYHAATTNDSNMRTEKSLIRIEGLLQRICVNGAKTATDRDACLRP